MMVKLTLPPTRRTTINRELTTRSVRDRPAAVPGNDRRHEPNWVLRTGYWLLVTEDLRLFLRSCGALLFI
jgi:hypothetical protein